MELDRILVGNLLTASHGFGWFFGEGETVFTAVETRGEHACLVKGISHVGFTGCFVSNLELSDHLALGRAVSHGFEWFTRTPPSLAR